jgi:hypothetical protein
VKIRLCLVLIAMLPFLVAPVMSEGDTQQINCSATTVDIPLPSARDGVFGDTVDAYLVISSQGCPLPDLYCIWEKHGYGGGLSCTSISEEVMNRIAVQ